MITAQIMSLGVWLMVVQPNQCPVTWQLAFEKFGSEQICKMQAVANEKNHPEYHFFCQQIDEHEVNNGKTSITG